MSRISSVRKDRSEPAKAGPCKAYSISAPPDRSTQGPPALSAKVGGQGLPVVAASLSGFRGHRCHTNCPLTNSVHRRRAGHPGGQGPQGPRSCGCSGSHSPRGRGRPGSGSGLGARQAPWPALSLALSGPGGVAAAGDLSPTPRPGDPPSSPEAGEGEGRRRLRWEPHPGPPGPPRTPRGRPSTLRRPTRARGAPMSSPAGA